MIVPGFLKVNVGRFNSCGRLDDFMYLLNLGPTNDGSHFISVSECVNLEPWFHIIYYALICVNLCLFSILIVNMKFGFKISLTTLK